VPSVVWTARSLGDLARLHAFLVTKSPEAASRAIGAIRAGVRTLEAHAAIGRPVESMAANCRDWWIPFGNSFYVVRYRLNGGQAVVLAVRHAREAGF
jgi:plasmid stabilization system protein ParE